jgi:hypothetical protein
MQASGIQKRSTNCTENVIAYIRSNYKAAPSMPCGYTGMFSDHSFTERMAQDNPRVLEVMSEGKTIKIMFAVCDHGNIFQVFSLLGKNSLRLEMQCIVYAVKYLRQVGLK